MTRHARRKSHLLLRSIAVGLLAVLAWGAFWLYVSWLAWSASPIFDWAAQPLGILMGAGSVIIGLGFGIYYHDRKDR